MTRVTRRPPPPPPTAQRPSSATSKKKTSTKTAHGGVRPNAGRKSLYGGKRRGAEITGVAVGVVISAEAGDALETVRANLSREHGYDVSRADAVEWCIRTAAGMP